MITGAAGTLVSTLQVPALGLGETRRLDTGSLRLGVRRGVAVAELTPAEKQAFARATRPVYDKWAQTVGSALVQKAEAAITRAIA